MKKNIDNLQNKSVEELIAIILELQKKIEQLEAAIARAKKSQPSPK